MSSFRKPDFCAIESLREREDRRRIERIFEEIAAETLYKVDENYTPTNPRSSRNPWNERHEGNHGTWGASEPNGFEPETKVSLHKRHDLPYSFCQEHLKILPLIHQTNVMQFRKLRRQTG